MIDKEHASGFSLFEMLLTVFIFAGILFAAYITLRDYAEDTLAQRTAAYYAEIHRALDEILLDAANFMAMHAVVTADPDNIVEISIADLISGSGIMPGAANNLNANFNAISPLRTFRTTDTPPFVTDITIMLRATGDASNPDDTPALEVIIASNGRTDDRRVRAVANYASGQGGFYRDSSEGIESAFATWRFALNNLNGTSWFTYANANDPVLGANGEGSYFVYYDHYNFDDLTGDYLYRRAVGLPQLNTMYAPLNMGTNNILGTDNINSNELNLSGQAIVNGTMNVVGATTINDGNFIARQQLSADSALIEGVGSGTRGNLTVQGQLDVTNSTINDSLSATIGNMQGGLETTAGNITSSGTLSASNTEVGGMTFIQQLNASSPANRPSLIVGQQVNTADISAENFTQSSGNTGVLDMIVGGNTDVNDLTAPDVTINQLDTETFGACDNGC